MAVQALGKFVAQGTVVDGENFVEGAPDAPPSDADPLSVAELPAEPGSWRAQEAYDAAMLWGKTADQLCNF